MKHCCKNVVILMPEPVAEPALNGLRLNLRIVSIVMFNFASYLTIGLPLAVLPGYVHDVMGFSAFWAGLVISLQYFATLLSRPHAGRYADSLGPKKIVVFGLCGCFLSGLGYLTAGLTASLPVISLLLLCLGRVILGIGQSFAGTGSTLWGVGVVVSFLLMILQAIAAPLPAFLITFANASLFGAFWGGLLSWTSSMAGAALCFFIARVMGREVVEKLTGKTVLDSMDGFFTRYGKHTILVCRLLPFVPFDPISYAAGLTSIRFRSFFIATGLGQLPATIVYSWAGSMLTGGTFWFVTGLFILFALTVVIFMAKKIWLERQKRNA